MRKVKGTLHWVSAEHALKVKTRLYETLFLSRDPNETKEKTDFTADLNPESISVNDNCYVEPSLKNASPGNRYQFERVGYFIADSIDSKPGKPVFNRIVSLKDTWGKIAKNKNNKNYHK